MREEWVDIPGSSPALNLWPETAEERGLQPVEKALLEATLREPAARQPDVLRQLHQVTCTCRRFTGYGIYLDLSLPSDSQPCPGLKGGEGGGATLNWRRSERYPLATVTFFEGGLLAMLEVYPSDGEGWSVEECRSITSSPLDAVDIS